jgi:HSP20 family protein
MRYRRLRVHYALVTPPMPAWPYGDMWPHDRLRILAAPAWRPDADLYETATTVEAAIELAGVDEDDVDIQLFDNMLVVEGRRRLPPAAEGRYHAAGIRQGAFQLALPLPAPIDSERVAARYERGLLRITLPKRVDVG